MSELIEKFKGELKQAILDPVGTHHRLASRRHGRKLDFDLIPTDSRLFEIWAETSAEELRKLAVAENIGRIALVSVANGTNRLVPHVAGKLGKGFMWALTTKEETSGVITLSDSSLQRLHEYEPELSVVMDDVGTTGESSLSVVIDLWSEGYDRVEVLNTWQRSPTLEKLDDYEIIYHSVIYEPLPSFTLEECWSQPDGYCARGWSLK